MAVTAGTAAATPGPAAPAPTDARAAGRVLIPACLPGITRPRCHSARHEAVRPAAPLAARAARAVRRRAGRPAHRRLLRRLKPGDDRRARPGRPRPRHRRRAGRRRGGRGGQRRRRRSPGGSPTWARRCWSAPASRWSTGSAPRCCTRSRTAAGSACTTACVYAGEQQLAEGVEQTADSVADAHGRGQVGADPPARGVRRQHHRVHAPRALAAARRRRRARRRGRPARTGRCWSSPPGSTTSPSWRGCKRYIREYRPVLIGVGAGADALLARRAPARPHRRRPGRDLQRGADLRRRRGRARPSPTGTRPACTGCRTSAPARSPSPARPTPRTWRCCWPPTTARRWSSRSGCRPRMAEFLDRGRSGSNASTFLTRLQLGGRLVDGRAVAALYRSRLSRSARSCCWSAAALVAVVAALLVSDAGRRACWPGSARAGRLRRHRSRAGSVVISLRYHAVSIAAVFLALAVGVVLGRERRLRPAALGRLRASRRPRRAGADPDRRAGRAWPPRSAAPTSSPPASARRPCAACWPGKTVALVTCRRRPGRPRRASRRCSAQAGATRHRRGRAHRRRRRPGARRPAPRAHLAAAAQPARSCRRRPTPAASSAACSAACC